VTVPVALSAVRAGYGPLEVLHGVDLQLASGTVTALLGANGAGKTTTLRVLAGTIPVPSGTIVWDGRPVEHLSTLERVRRGLVLITEERAVFPGLSVRDNLEAFAGAPLLTAGAGAAEPALAAVWDAFPVLRDRLGQRAGSLSGGEQQMLALARALLVPPRVLLLDEISTGLAPRVVDQLYEVVADLASRAQVTLLVEQYVGRALALAEVAYVLARGEVVFAGEPAELAESGLPV